MNSFRTHFGKKRRKAGFGLAEVSFSIGVLSFGFLSLAPLLALGIKASRGARDERISAHIAEGLVEQARQGTLSPGTVYLDDTGAVVISPQAAAFTAQSSRATPAGTLTQWTLRVTPSGAPDRVRVYAVVLPTSAPAAP